MDLGTWVSVGSLLAVGIALGGLMLSAMGRMERRLDARMDRMDGRFDRIDGRMDRIDARMDRIEGRIDKLDDRVYSLAAGLKPLVEEAQARRSATP